MRKSTYIFIITAVLSLSSIVAMHIYMSIQGENIISSISPIYGDINNLKGLTINSTIVQSRISDKPPHWEITQNFDEKLSSKATFFVEEEDFNYNIFSQYQNKNILTIHDDFGDGKMRSVKNSEFSNAVDSLEIPSRYFKKLEQKTLEGEESIETIYINDFWTYYPVSVGKIEIEELENGEYEQFPKSSSDDYDTYGDVYLTSYFEIPIEENHSADIYLKKFSDEDKIEFSATDKNTSHSLLIADTFTEDGIYASVYSNEYDKHKRGINFLPFEIREYPVTIVGDWFNKVINMKSYSPTSTGAKLIYPVGENTKVLEIIVDEKNSVLMAVCEIKNSNENTFDIVLKVIDLNTYEDVQEILLFDDIAEQALNIHFMQKFKDFYYISFTNDDFVIIIEQDNLYSVDLEGSTKILNNDVPYHIADMDYKDNMLALTFFDNIHNTGLYLAIFDSSGLTTYSKIDNNILDASHNYLSITVIYSDVKVSFD